MTTKRSRHDFPVMMAGALLISTSCALSTISYAEVTADTSTLGNLGTGVTAGPSFDITGGTRPGGGSNLFHSFDSFSLTSSETANFVNDSGLATTNVLGRVTGGDPSSIYGTIQTTGFPGANLYLINPSGILFGPTAQLNVEGSFHATTADYMKLGSDGIFYANVAENSVLTMSAPSAFGFLDSNPGSIEVHTGGIDFDTYLPTALLEVPEGETLSLVGGPIDLGTSDFSTSGFLLAPAGTVNMVSVASAGEATLDSPVNTDGFTELGDINISGGSIVDAKNIYIRGGNLVIDESVLVPGGFAYELSFVGYSPLPDGGEVNVKVSDSLSMTGTDLELLTLAAPGIFVYTGDFFDISPAAKVPDVNIDAGSVSISGVAGISVSRNAPGEIGNVVINANDVTIGSGGSITLINAYAGDDPTAPGPSLTINARTLDVSGDGSGSAYGYEGIAAQGLVNLAYLFPYNDAELITANSGNITINASDSVSVRGLGQITTDNRVFGSSGDITINTGDLLVEGTGDANSAFIGSQSAFAADSGDIVINATGGIAMTDGARISSASLGSGDAGDVMLTAAGPITLDGNDTRILGATYEPPDDVLNDLFLEVFYWYSFDDVRADMGDPDASLMEVLAFIRDVYGDITIPDLDLTPGDGGAITISAPTLTMNTGTRIETSTGWEGNAGSVTANVDSLYLNDGATIRSRSGVEFLDGTGHVGPGAGGAVNINAANTVSISGTDSAISTSTFGDGDGGDIKITGNDIYIRNGGFVSADSGGTLGGESLSGSGLAGNINMNAADKIELADGTISTRAVTADGGNVELNAPNLVYLLNSDITTSVESGVGGGGNIIIDPEFVVLNQSNILANAYGGPGGNITIVADNVIVSAQSSIDASSELGIDGTINISNPDQDIAKELAVLPENYLDVTGLISDRCGTSAGSSSLVSAGPGGLAVDPDGYLPGFAVGTGMDDAGNGGNTRFDGGGSWLAPGTGTALSSLQLVRMNCTY